MEKVKSILFLSGLDFKEKSIQVISKTPEAYAAAGWRVRYLVWRDPHHPDYQYERIVDPPGVEVHRFSKPLANFRFVRNSRIFSRVASLLAIFQLARRGQALLRQEPSQVLYGYEVFGVLALQLLCIFRPPNFVKVARFQGVALLNLSLRNSGKWATLLSHWQALLAYMIPADLCIMTNDGTRGHQLLKSLRSPLAARAVFWPNGVAQTQECLLKVLPPLPPATHILCTNCRLVEGKGLRSCLKVIAELVHRFDFSDFLYVLVGGGPLEEELKKLVVELQIEPYIHFTGPLLHSSALAIVGSSDACLLTYEYSNVGNPLLEAIAAKRAVFTLDREDTKEWISHLANGFIYPPLPGWEIQMASDLKKYLSDPEFRQRLKPGAGKSKVWSWGERLTAETQLLASLVERLDKELPS